MANATPRLLTRRLRLRPWRDDDLGPLSRMTADPVAMRYLGEGRPATLEECREVLAEWRQEWEEWSHGRWAIDHRVSRVLVGNVGLVRYRPGTAEERLGLACFVERAWWGYGIASEAATAALDWAFEVLPWDEVVAMTHPDNAASQHVLTKLGFAPAGQFQRRFRMLDGFRLSKEVWLARR